MTTSTQNLQQITNELLSLGLTPKHTILPMCNSTMMEDIHGKLTWCDNWDHTIPTDGDTGEDSDGTQPYMTSRDMSEEYDLSQMTGYSMYDLGSTSIDESLEWESIEEEEHQSIKI